MRKWVSNGGDAFFGRTLTRREQKSSTNEYRYRVSRSEEQRRSRPRSNHACLDYQFPGLGNPETEAQAKDNARADPAKPIDRASYAVGSRISIKGFWNRHGPSVNRPTSPKKSQTVNCTGKRTPSMKLLDYCLLVCVSTISNNRDRSLDLLSLLLLFMTIVNYSPRPCVRISIDASREYQLRIWCVCELRLVIYREIKSSSRK